MERVAAVAVRGGEERSSRSARARASACCGAAFQTLRPPGKEADRAVQFGGGQIQSFTPKTGLVKASTRFGLPAHMCGGTRSAVGRRSVGATGLGHQGANARRIPRV